jgi:hypothetical protein
MLVHRAWVRAGIKPHRIKRYMRSNDLILDNLSAHKTQRVIKWSYSDSPHRIRG